MSPPPDSILHASSGALGGIFAMSVNLLLFLKFTLLDLLQLTPSSTASHSSGLSPVSLPPSILTQLPKLTPLFLQHQILSSVSPPELRLKQRIIQEKSFNFTSNSIHFSLYSLTPSLALFFNLELTRSCTSSSQT